MLKLFLFLAVLILPAQSDSSAFSIDRVEVYAEYGSVYILRLANQLVPPDKQSSKSDIDCLKKELRLSGLFADDVRARLVQEGTSRKLIITATPNPQLAGTVVSEITLDGFPELSKTKFQSALDKNGISAGEPLTKYSLNELMERITKALQELYQSELHESDVDIPWISIRPAEPGKVRLIVSPAFTGCNAAQGH